MNNPKTSLELAGELAFQMGYDYDSWDRWNSNPYPVGTFLWKRWESGRIAKERHRRDVGPGGRRPIWIPTGVKG